MRCDASIRTMISDDGKEPGIRSKDESKADGDFQCNAQKSKPKRCKSRKATLTAPKIRISRRPTHFRIAPKIPRTFFVRRFLQNVECVAVTTKILVDSNEARGLAGVRDWMRLADARTTQKMMRRSGKRAIFSRSPAETTETSDGFDRDQMQRNKRRCITSALLV